MKKLIMLWLFSCVACTETQEELAAYDRQQAEQNGLATPRFAGQMVFFQHHESGLCFAYFWGGSGNGGPALATVPCEKVEALLVNRR